MGKVTKDNWIKALVKLFDGNDGTVMPTWLLCYNGELDTDPPFDCGCCLDGHRNDRKDCGCVCHKRFKIIIDFISQVEKDAEKKGYDRAKRELQLVYGGQG